MTYIPATIMVLCAAAFVFFIASEYWWDKWDKWEDDDDE